MGDNRFDALMYTVCWIQVVREVDPWHGLNPGSGGEAKKGIIAGVGPSSSAVEPETNV